LVTIPQVLQSFPQNIKENKGIIDTPHFTKLIASMQSSSRNDHRNYIASATSIASHTAYHHLGRYPFRQYHHGTFPSQA